MIGLSKKGVLKAGILVFVVLLLLLFAVNGILSFAETAEEEKLRLEAELAQLEQELSAIDGGKWVNNSCSVAQIFFKSYNCDGSIGYHVVKVLTSGIHNQRFNFSNQIADAHNLASAQNITTPYRQFVDDKAADFNQGNYSGTITDGENVTLWNGTIELSPDYDTVNTVLLMHFNNDSGEFERPINETHNVSDGATNLILYMKFNNETGENDSYFRDWSVMNNSGNCTGNPCPAYNKTEFKFGGAALTFDGTNDYVNVSDNDDWAFGARDFSIESWLRFNSVANADLIGQGARANTNVWYLYFESSALKFTQYASDVNNIAISNSWSPSAGTWYHVAMRRNGNDFSMYIDGTKIGTQTDADTIADQPGSLKIGWSGVDTRPFLNGQMDEVAIWNISLSADKIAEHAGAKIIDYSNYKNNGTRTNFSGSDFGRNFTAGKFGKGLVFNGVNTFVNVSDNPTLDLTDKITLEAWILSNDTSPLNKGILSKSRGGEVDTYMLRTTNGAEGGGRFTFYINPSGGARSVSGTTTINANVWYHVAGTYDGSNARLYVNGVLENQSSTSGSFTNTISELFIGTHNYFNSGAFFNGTIDELRIMNISLPAEQILRDYYKGNSTHYNNLTGNFTSRVFDANRTVRFDTIMWNETTPRNELVNQSGMVLLMHFNNDSSIGENNSQFYDYTGLGNNGTCVLASNQCPVVNKTEFKFGGAGLTFDGVNDFVNVTNTSLIPNSVPMNISLEAWIKPNTPFSTTVDIMVKGSTYRLSLGDMISGGKLDRPAFSISVSIWAKAISPDTIDSNWHHIVGIYDKTNAYAYIYVDGILKNSTPAVGAADNQPTDLTIGSAGGPNNNFNGTIDEVAIWNRSLSAYEIYDHYSRGADRYINMSYRTSSDNITWNSWAYTKNNATLTSITGRYVQYRADFTTNSTLFTPYLENVTINYSVVINLTIWDETDTIARVLGQPVRFYANFTDIGNNSINGTNINCSFSHNNTGSFSAETNMSFNSTLGIYFIDQQFFTNWTAFYNITCDATALGYNKVKVLDDFIIYPSLNITVNLNATSTLTSRPIAVSGKVNLSNGTNVSNTRIFIYLNGSEQNLTRNFTDTSDTDFNKGTFINVSVVGTGSTANITLNSNITNGNSYPNQTGNFTSQTFDAGGISNWNSISWNDFANNTYGRDINDTINASVVLMMHFDNSSRENDTYFIDQSQYSNNGNCTGTTCPVYNSSSKFGRYALTFDGVDDYITLNLTYELPIIAQTEYSVAFWYKFAGDATKRGLYEEIDPGVLQYFLIGKSTTNKALIYIESSTGAKLGNKQSNTTIADNTWHFIVWTDNNGAAKFYIDGVQDSTYSYTRSGTFSAPTAWLGQDGSGSYGKGDIDEFAIWNISLESDEIKRHAMRGLTNLSIYYATSNDTVTWGDWSRATNNTLTTLNMSARYLRYLAKFNTSSANLTPILHDVTINYSGIFTDSFGNYNYTFTAPSSAGTYPIKVNATWSSIPGEQTVNLGVKNAQTINCQVASCFIVQSPSGSYLAVIDSMGNMNVLNVLTQSQEPTADINDFVVQNSTGGLNLVVTNPEGNLLIKKELTQSQGTLSPTLSAFIVQNRTGAVVAYANSTGGLFLTGALTDQVLFE